MASAVRYYPGDVGGAMQLNMLLWPKELKDTISMLH